MKFFKKGLSLVIFSVVLLSALIFYFWAKNNSQTQAPSEQTNSNSYSNYTVKEGDTLGTIAEKFYGGGDLWVEIAKVNNLTDPNLLEVGMILKIPKLKTSTSVTSTPTSAAVSVGSGYPSSVLNLTSWKLTLPIGPAESPTEIKQPELASFQIEPWFVVLQGGGVRFRAPVNGVTTSGSNYPRSELREMTNNGADKASWNSTSGTHSLFLDQAITALPFKKKHIVVGQIHDAANDVIVIRLEDRSLYVNVDSKNVHLLDANYTLGKRFTIRFVVNGDQTKVYYNNSADSAYILNKSYSGAYFKAGAYTQSNCSKEGSSLLCNENNYGEVVVYQAIVTHQID